MLAKILLALWSVSVVAYAMQPSTIALQGRKVPRENRLQRRALEPEDVPLADFFINTDLQWFGDIQVGEPPQNVSVVFDTGSSTLEFVSTACGAACVNQTKFDPTFSTTFVDTKQVHSISFSTGVGVDVVENPADWTLTLRSATDTVSVGGLATKNVSLFVITNQTITFGEDPFSGIQGMSTKAQGFFAGLISQGLPSLFGLFLSPLSVGNAELTIGGIDETKFQSNLTFADLASTSAAWTLNSSALFVNGKTDPDGILSAKRRVIFDSGTSNVLFDTRTTNAMYALISPDIQPHASEPGAYGIACEKVDSLPAVIDVAFTDVNGTPFNLTIPSTELSVGPFADDPSTCQTLINAFDTLELVGGSLMKHYYTVHDVGNQQMGFAPTGF